MEHERLCETAHLMRSPANTRRLFDSMRRLDRGDEGTPCHQSDTITAMAMTLRLSPDDEKLLADLAQIEGLSRQETTVRAIREKAARQDHSRRVAEASEDGRARYADLLRRLGE